ncbi:hypothetical protein VDF98_03720 [Xanthomonas campestris pv. raphani]|uniref:hypothetical protein n=1 Tax=Pseudomonadota TaxID=1224 RepID=UPI001E536958|nr:MULTISPECIES: hypothetical protein [Pseudomonadota]MCC4586513.1 hypothetical protein [Xanthomonas sp. NCPPB 1067]MEA9822355.1 hypothetical protein [Xanthomonas campestris pv. raphani]MEA9850912.1 hypothetical protein [Xanthomonas campestris pv. raphani]MEA9855085.1 hypothetical protein [Xanthomonas campestris pv. raphani]MEA9963798.1 hypothetical protein [Xanthomonas campestris pv. raphani]
MAFWAKAAAALVVAAISLTLNTLIANAISADAARKRYATTKQIIDRLTGGLLTFFGARLFYPNRNFAAMCGQAESAFTYAVRCLPQH